MDKIKIIEIVKDIENKSSKDLFSAEKFLEKEFDSTKEIIINLTRHLESVEVYYNNINEELKRRKIRV